MLLQIFTPCAVTNFILFHAMTKKLLIVFVIIYRWLYMLKLVSPDPCLKVYCLITSTVSHSIHMSDLKKYICRLDSHTKQTRLTIRLAPSFVYFLKNRHFQCLDSWLIYINILTKLISCMTYMTTATYNTNFDRWAVFMISKFTVWCHTLTKI